MDGQGLAQDFTVFPGQGLQPHPASAATLPLRAAPVPHTAVDATGKPSLFPGCTEQLTKAVNRRDVLIWF